MRLCRSKEEDVVEECVPQKRKMEEIGYLKKYAHRGEMKLENGTIKISFNFSQVSFG